MVSIQFMLQVASFDVISTDSLWFPSPINTPLFVLAKVLLKGANFTSLGIWFALWEILLAEFRPSLSEPFIEST